MSITVTTDVFCDGCGGAWCQGPSENKANIRGARRMAKAAGWSRQGGDDLCPRLHLGEGCAMKGLVAALSMLAEILIVVSFVAVVAILFVGAILPVTFGLDDIIDMAKWTMVGVTSATFYWWSES